MTVVTSPKSVLSSMADRLPVTIATINYDGFGYHRLISMPDNSVDSATMVTKLLICEI